MSEQFKGKPITPNEALDNKLTIIPGMIFDVINSLIVKRLDHNTAVVKQTEITYCSSSISTVVPSSKIIYWTLSHFTNMPAGL